MENDQYCRYQLGRWHSLKVLDEGTVLFEAKNVKYEPMKEEDVMKLDISRRTGGETACSSNRWNSESRDISSHIIFADLQPVLSEVEV